jgi:hypothetical protein
MPSTITSRPKLGVAIFVGWAALFASAVLGVALAFDVHRSGGPDLLSHARPEITVFRLVVLLPAPGVAAFTILGLPRTRVFLIVWLAIIAVSLALHIPLLFPEHAGAGAVVLLALVMSSIGLALARGRRFREICAVYDRMK